MPTKITKKKTTSATSTTTKAIQKAVDVAVTDAIAEFGKTKFTCPACGRALTREDFYMSTDPIMKTGISTICKQCAWEIAHPTINGKASEPTRDSIIEALQRLDRPFKQDIYESSIEEANKLKKNGKVNFDVWGTYIKNIAMPQYRLERFKNSEFTTAETRIKKEANKKEQEKEILENYEINKKDVIRLLGYDPFESESEDSKPRLYAQTVSYLDASGEANEDALRVSSIIEIVQGFAHIEKLNAQEADLFADKSTLANNANTIKAIEAIKTQITSNIQKLAQESCISLKNSKSNTKGENTFTGKLRKLKDMNLREQEVNLFDANTIEGMLQVAKLSNKAILEELRLDENDEHNMLIEQRELLQKYQEQASRNEELARVLLRENTDLKSTLKENGLLNE